jgi:hypothetical protein
MTLKSKSRNPIDMSLRLWSKDVPLHGMAEAFQLSLQHLHVKGGSIEREGRPSGRTAARHFASMAQAGGQNDDDIADWLRRTSAAVASNRELANLLHTGHVEALFWIAFFGPEPVPTPALDASLVKAVADLGARIFLENYTDLGPDCPTKVWLPAAPPHLPEKRPA